MRPLAFVVVTFDDNDGPVIAHTVPSDVELSAAERDAVRFHALPDSSVVGELQFSFRIAAGPLRTSERESINSNNNNSSSSSSNSTIVAPNSISSSSSTMAVDASHLFGHVFFRLTRDASLRRGADRNAMSTWASVVARRSSVHFSE